MGLKVVMVGWWMGVAFFGDVSVAAQRAQLRACDEEPPTSAGRPNYGMRFEQATLICSAIGR